jgi:hypothetical protein
VQDQPNHLGRCSTLLSSSFRSITNNQSPSNGFQHERTRTSWTSSSLAALDNDFVVPLEALPHVAIVVFYDEIPTAPLQ